MSLPSLAIPVFNEADNVVPQLRDVEAKVREPHEVLLVYDFPEDSTLPAVAAMRPPCPAVRLVHNTLGRGVLNALKAGFRASRGDVVVVMMADRSDDPRDVPALARLVRAGADVVAGSRHCRRVVEQIPVEGTVSFALALELTLKAHWRGWRVAEVPTVWRDRTAGQSRFRLWAWLPHYLRWYLRALGHAWLGTGRRYRDLDVP